MIVIELSVDQVLEEFGEHLVQCPNPDCDSDELIDAQEIIARPGDPEAEIDPVKTPCCQKSRDELFEEIDPKREGEPMEDAYKLDA